ncbi:MAG: hypothetical protein BM555_04465 [Crocinitomix sp. MedPE-SWsnd]|nr:MAG: hypothetical protein BM555_04465 [Crocinitomix sp. MedPE-SWsnd]
MKSFFLIIAIAFCSISINAQGVEFYMGDFESAKLEAAKEKKLIFIDCYTFWCAPCKAMDKEVFQDPKVAKYLKKNYISLKINMETDDGMEIMQKYVITKYPTLLFTTATGEEIRRGAKRMSADEFITLAKGVVKPGKSVPEKKSKLKKMN